MYATLCLTGTLVLIVQEAAVAAVPLVRMCQSWHRKKKECLQHCFCSHQHPEYASLCLTVTLALFVQEAAVAAVSGEDVSEPAEEEGVPAAFGSTSNLSATQSGGGEDSEVARFGAAKEKKHSLENGITVFNRYACCKVVHLLFPL